MTNWYCTEDLQSIGFLGESGKILKCCQQRHSNYCYPGCQCRCPVTFVAAATVDLALRESVLSTVRVAGWRPFTTSTVGLIRSFRVNLGTSIETRTTSHHGPFAIAVRPRVCAKALITLKSTHWKKKEYFISVYTVAVLTRTRSSDHAVVVSLELLSNL